MKCDQKLMPLFKVSDHYGGLVSRGLLEAGQVPPKCGKYAGIKILI